MSFPNKANFIKNIETIKQPESFSTTNIKNIAQKFIKENLYMSPIKYFYIRPNEIQAWENYYIIKLRNESPIGVEYVQRISKRAFFYKILVFA